MKKTKKEWVKWFNSLDDDVEIEIIVSYSTECDEKGKLKKLKIVV